METCYELYRQAFTVLVEASEIMAARRQERRECERVPRVKSPLMLREFVDETSIPTRSALVPLKSLAIPETLLISLLLRYYKQLSSGLHTLSSQSYSPAHA